MYNVIIIGGGASGLFAAASYDKEAQGLIIEKKNKPGRKLLMSGGGQCNITHGGSIKDFVSHYGAHGGRIRKALYAAGNMRLIEFINSLGVPTFEREDGKVFPISLKAEDVRFALERRAKDNGFRIAAGESVVRIESMPEGEGYRIHTDGGNAYEGRKIIIATGGKSYPGTGSDGSMLPVLESMGLEIVETAPALTSVYVHEYGYESLSGISFKDAEVSVYEEEKLAASNSGDLLLTHKNFSGPAVINMSRDIRTGMTMVINFVAPLRGEDLAGRINQRSRRNQKSVGNFLVELIGLPSAFINVIISEAGIDASRKANTLTGAESAQIAVAFAHHEYHVSGLGGYNEAMVMRGGVSLDEINMKTMELKRLPGIYCIGEVVDIDGDTGGYNLQWCYSSAVAAVNDIK